MLAIAIDLAGEVPIYRQIADELRRLIAQGELPVGADLPSVRELGRWIGVNPNTVAKAYRTLADEGVVKLRHGAGATVSAGAPTRPTRDELDLESQRKLQEILSRWVLRGVDRARAERWLDRVVTDFFEGRSI